MKFRASVPLLALLFVPLGCAARVSTPAPLAALAALAAMPFHVDTLRTERVTDGVVHRFIYSSAGPWAINVLDVDLDRCNAIEAVKGTSGAAGRVKTSDALAMLARSARSARSARVIGGVNADFFSLVPPLGLPIGALVANGTLVTGPANQAVLAVDSSGRLRITTLRANGFATIDARRFTVSNWNRAVRDGIAFFDSAWGARTDTATGAVEVALAGRDPSRVVAVDTLTGGVSIPADGGVLIAGRGAPAETRAALLALRPGDTVRVAMSLAPLHPMQAVGGRPEILRDSVIGPDVDTFGQASFNVGRNPRTAAGVASNGRRLILAVVDGREKPYSDGMSLRELSTLMRALGARDAINLDGGGSSTLVYSDPHAAGELRVANRPSDKEGERAVGDVLAVVHRCN